MCIKEAVYFNGWVLMSWLLAEFFQRGQNQQPLKYDSFLGAPKAQSKIALFFATLYINFNAMLVYSASAQRAGENFWKCRKNATYYVIFFKFHGGGKCPLFPLRESMATMVKTKKIVDIH